MNKIINQNEFRLVHLSFSAMVSNTVMGEIDIWITTDSSQLYCTAKLRFPSYWGTVRTSVTDSLFVTVQNSLQHAHYDFLRPGLRDTVWIVIERLEEISTALLSHYVEVIHCLNNIFHRHDKVTPKAPQYLNFI
jgi:hypothetical protein